MAPPTRFGVFPATFADRLSVLVTGRQVRCIPVSTDQYDRVLARCSVIGTDVNRTMVATGYAVAFRKYSADYVSTEESAKLTKQGIWAGTFQMPSEVRATQGRPERSSVPPARPVPKVVQRYSGGCVIKGNHSCRGEWIYYPPKARRRTPVDDVHIFSLLPDQHRSSL